MIATVCRRRRRARGGRRSTAHAPARLRGGPGDADVAAEARRARRRRRRGGRGRGAVGGERLGGRAEVERDARGMRTRPPMRVELDPRQRACGRDAEGRVGRRARDDAEVASGSRARAASSPTVGIDEPARRDRCAQRGGERRAEAARRSRRQRRTRRSTRESSESGRNRLQAASIARSSRATRGWASSSARGSVVTTEAVVPSAGRPRTPASMADVAPTLTNRPRRRPARGRPGAPRGPAAAWWSAPASCAASWSRSRPVRAALRRARSRACARARRAALQLDDARGPVPTRRCACALGDRTATATFVAVLALPATAATSSAAIVPAMATHVGEQARAPQPDRPVEPVRRSSSAR